MGEFHGIVVQELGDQQSPFAYAGTDNYGNTVEDPYDIDMTRTAKAHTLIICRRRNGQSEYKEIVRVSDTEIDMTITDCRVIYRCDNYDRGSTWSGGLSAIALNAIERSRAKKRIEGKTFLGHTRYEWITDVGYIMRPKHGFKPALYAIRVFIEDKEKSKYYIETCFAPGMDTSFIANEILHLASAYKLAMTDEKNEKELGILNRNIKENIRLNDDPDRFSIESLAYGYLAPGGKDFRPNLG